MPSVTRREAALGAWGAAIGTMVAADVYLHRTIPECTLSHVSRSTLRVEHPVGEALFVAGWGALSVWLIPHIVRPARLSRRARAVLTSATATKG